ncbi:unnamed protein product [Chrysoparadoxa australica]
MGPTQNPNPKAHYLSHSLCSEHACTRLGEVRLVCRMHLRKQPKPNHKYSEYVESLEEAKQGAHLPRKHACNEQKGGRGEEKAREVVKLKLEVKAEPRVAKRSLKRALPSAGREDAHGSGTGEARRTRGDRGKREQEVAAPRSDRPRRDRKVQARRSDRARTERNLPATRSERSVEMWGRKRKAPAGRSQRAAKPRAPSTRSRRERQAAAAGGKEGKQGGPTNAAPRYEIKKSDEQREGDKRVHAYRLNSQEERWVVEEEAEYLKSLKSRARKEQSERAETLAFKLERKKQMALHVMFGKKRTHFERLEDKELEAFINRPVRFMSHQALVAMENECAAASGQQPTKGSSSTGSDAAAGNGRSGAPNGTNDRVGGASNGGSSGATYSEIHDCKDCVICLAGDNIRSNSGAKGQEQAVTKAKAGCNADDMSLWCPPYRQLAVQHHYAMVGTKKYVRRYQQGLLQDTDQCLIIGEAVPSKAWWSNPTALATRTRCTRGSTKNVARGKRGQGSGYGTGSGSALARAGGAGNVPGKKRKLPEGGGLMKAKRRGEKRGEGVRKSKRFK